MRNSKRGFTLIELLVVIAIIAILAAILFPIFTAARAAARTTQCASNCSQIAKAMRGYASDWGGFLPYAESGGVSWYAGNTGCWERKLAEGHIESSPEIFVCQETKGYIAPGQYMTSFSMNGLLTHYANGNWGKVTSVDSINDAVAPSKLIVIFEISSKNRVVDDYSKVWDQSNEYFQTSDGLMSTTGNDYWYCLRFPGPHKGGIGNVVFADGHVKGYKTWVSSQMTFFPSVDPK